MMFRALVALQVLLCLLRLDSVWSRVVNRTIDDTFGDSETQRLPLYLPSTSGVWKGASCSGCAINPDVDKAFKSTYQAATYAPNSGKISITLTFNGECGSASTLKEPLNPTNRNCDLGLLHTRQ